MNKTTTTQRVIQRNSHPAGRLNNALFGLFQIVDGLTRVFSLGFLHTTLTLDHSRRTAKRQITKRLSSK